MAPQSKRGQELKKKPLNVTKASSQHPQISSHAATLFFEFKDDLLKFRWHSYNILNRLK
jgi:hypothetical protein